MSERTLEQAFAHAEKQRAKKPFYTPNKCYRAIADLVLLADEIDRLQVKNEVFSEMIKAMVSLGAQSDLLCIVCSFGDTMGDDEVLEALREWNTLHSAET